MTWQTKDLDITSEARTLWGAFRLCYGANASPLLPILLIPVILISPSKVIAIFTALATVPLLWDLLAFWWKFRRGEAGQRLIERIEFTDGLVLRVWDAAGTRVVKSFFPLSGKGVNRVTCKKGRVYLHSGNSSTDTVLRSASFVSDEEFERFVTHFAEIVDPSDASLMSGYNDGFHTQDVELPTSGLAKLLGGKLCGRTIITRDYVSFALVRNGKRMRFGRWKLMLADVWALKLKDNDIVLVDRGPFESVRTLDRRAFCTEEEAERFVAHLNALGIAWRDLPSQGNRA